MKHYIFYLIIISICFTACDEEFVGQPPIDSTPPASVSNVKVENIPGGVILTYDLPEEDDLLCITAEYVTPKGGMSEMSSSAYSNSITVKGYGKAQKATIKLYSVDKSLNRSEPVLVEVETTDSPIYDIFKTLTFREDFGGIRPYWENPLNEEIVFEVMIKDEIGRYNPAGTVYSSDAVYNRAVRGMESKESEFALCFRDLYNNYTDTIFTTMTPFFEMELDKKKFSGLPQSSNFTQHSWSKGFGAMWDNVFFTDANVYYLQQKNSSKPVLVYFGFDMGIEAKLSRFTIWSREKYCFTLHHMRTFEIWGTSDPTKANNIDSWDGWTKIMDCESFRPSGKTDGGEVSEAEVEYCRQGEEFEIPLDAPAFRYMKIRVNSTWSNSTSAYVGEITIWGEPTN